MVRGCHDHVGAEQHPTSDVDVPVIQQGQVKVGVDAVAEVHVGAAPAGAKRRLDITALAAFGENLFHIGFPSLRIEGIQLIERPELPLVGLLQFHDLRIAGVEDESLDHSFFLRHVSSPLFVSTRRRKNAHSSSLHRRASGSLMSM